MANFDDINEIPDSYRLPKSTLVVTLGQAEWSNSQNSGNRLVSIPVTVTDVLEPPAAQELVNREFNIRIVVGTQNDPEADQNDTWFQRGGRNYKQLIQAALGKAVKLAGNPEEWIYGTLDYSVGAVVDVDGDFNNYTFFATDQEPPPHREPRQARSGGASAPSGPRPAPARPSAERGPRPTVARGNGHVPTEDQGMEAQAEPRTPAPVRRPPPRQAR